MYSVTDRQSYLELCRLKDVVFSIKSPETPIVLVSNKCDLLTARAVTEDDGLSLAGDMDCPKYEISVAEGAQGVLDVMEELVRQIQREYVKNLTTRPVESLEKKSKLYNMKRAFKKRIARSRSDTF